MSDQVDAPVQTPSGLPLEPV
ncbi:MAG: hypothetical protein JWQ86_3373, partial [Mycobacterium sp.]|nr:hypothetical protein [Mycobacterium sp.]